MISWNVRGLNERKKRLDVRETILLERPSLVCLQETKLANIQGRLLLEVCGYRLQKTRALDPIGTRGGILIAWADHLYEEVSFETQQFSISVRLKNRQDEKQFMVTGVYGPSTNVGRQQFLQELTQTKPISTPWVLCGDFNITTDASERTNPNANWHTPFRFSQLISSLGLLNTALQNRQYTWSNEREAPSMARLDRFLISTEWNHIYPNSSQTALPNTASDHCLILYTANTGFDKTRVFRFENLWLKFTQLHDIVQTEWVSRDIATNPIEMDLKLKSLQKCIKEWAETKVGSIKKQINVCREFVGWMDRVKEVRAPTDLEISVLRRVKHRYVYLAVLEEDIWRQRAKTK